MNNEFKKIQDGNLVRYVLETSTAGTTSASNISTSEKNLGEIQKRVPQKPRQGPLKPQTGGGAHRDKKKEQKQGKEKHRKPFAEQGVAEGLADEFMKMEQAKGYNVRQAGTPEQERERTQQMLAQRAKERQEQERQAALADAEKLPELKAKFEEMKKLYQSLGGSNWQYADREQNLTDAERKARSMETELNRLGSQIARAEKAQGVAEGDDPLQNRADYARQHGPGQVYKKTHPGDKVEMTESYAYDVKRTGPKGQLPKEGVEEMYGRRSSFSYNPDRDAGREWDAARRSDQDFRNRERNVGVEHETNNIQVEINGKRWKVFPGRGPADSMEERAHLEKMKRWAERKSLETGKEWKVYITGAPATTNEMHEPDHEVGMAQADMYQLLKQANTLHKILMKMSEVQGLEGWQQSKITKAADYINAVYKNMVHDVSMDGEIGEGNKRDHQVYGDPGENPRMRRNDYSVKNPKYGARTYFNVPADKEDVARNLHMVQDKEGKWYMPDFANLSDNETLQLLGTAEDYFGRGEYFPAKKFMEPAWQTEGNGVEEGFADIIVDDFELGEKVEYDQSVWTVIGKDQEHDLLTIARDIEKVDPLKVGKVKKEINETENKRGEYKDRKIELDRLMKTGKYDLSDLELLDLDELKQLKEAAKKGLYYYVNRRKKAGTSRPKSHPKAPSEQDWKNAAKTAKKESTDPYISHLNSMLESKVKEEAPPGWSEAEMKELKKKYGNERAFAVAWAAYKKAHPNWKPKSKK